MEIASARVWRSGPVISSIERIGHFGSDHRLERPDRPERHQHGEIGVLVDDALSRLQFLVEIVDEQAAIRACRNRRAAWRRSLIISLVRCRLAQIWPCGCGLRAPHHRAAVLEDLHLADVGPRAEFAILLDPGLDHLLDVGHRHARQRQVVARREADDAADAGFALGDQQAAFGRLSLGASGVSAAKSLSKTKVVLVGGVDGAAGAADCRRRDSTEGSCGGACGCSAAFRPGPARAAWRGAARPAPIRRSGG